MGTYVFSTPTLTPMGTENRYQLAENWLVRAPGMDFTVPKGFIFDGASIPRALWRLCGSPYDAPRVIAALAHDFLYATHICTRKEADIIYRDMQIDLSIAAWKARVEYRALRLFGWIAWKNRGTMNHLATLAILAIISLLCGCETMTVEGAVTGVTWAARAYMVMRTFCGGGDSVD